MLLENKVAIITGASRGIGKSIAELFAKEGAIVYATVREENVLDAMISKENLLGKIIPCLLDITDSSAIKELIMRIKKEQGQLDILVNNAGIMQDALIGMIPEKMYRDIFDVNVFAGLECMQYASKLMTRQKSGSIINLSSIVGVEGSKGQAVYSASKGAIISLTKSASQELASSNIRVNAIAPGYIETDLFLNIPEEKRLPLINNVSLGRFGKPEDIAKACLFFASDLSEYVTGQILLVDGGIH